MIAIVHGTIPVSIHAPRAGRDTTEILTAGAVKMFQSTRPARGATINWSVWLSLGAVSIHAPRAGRDRIYSMSTRRGL